MSATGSALILALSRSYATFLLARRHLALASLERTEVARPTLLRLLAGRALPTEGSIDLLGRDDSSSGAAYVPQVSAEGLWDDLSVRETLTIAASRGRLLWPGYRRWQVVRSALPWLPALIETRLDSDVRTLSGGERQVLLLACALASSSVQESGTGLIADEFTASLDPSHMRLARDALKEVISSVLGSQSFIFATHSYFELLEFADQVLALSKGSVLWCRPVAEVTNEIFQNVYESTE